MPLFDVFLQFTSPCLKQSLCVPKEFTVLHIEQLSEVELNIRLRVDPDPSDSGVSDETMRRHGIQDPVLTRASTELLRWITSLRVQLQKYLFYLSSSQGLETAETSINLPIGQLKLENTETSINLPIGQLKLETAETSINSSNELLKLDPIAPLVQARYDVPTQTSKRICRDSEGSTSELHSGSSKRRRLLHMGSDDLRPL